MLRIVTGPFYPDLEGALVDEIRRLKADDPLAPLTIIVPSDPLRRRLKWLLCIEEGCALLDVHFLTFHQFALRLLNEAGADAPSQVRPEFFFKELIHHLLRRLAAASPAWSNLVEMPGAWAALWATVRDVKDAKVETERVLEALSQRELADALSRAGPVSDAALRSLLALYDAFLTQKGRIHAFDQDDLAALAEFCVPTSAFLRRQRRLFYYGFYDLTQIQLDLFQAVARAYPATLFFPLVKDDPSFLFAQRFFERYIHGLITRREDWKETPAGRHQPGRAEPHPFCQVVNVSGREDEVTVVAKDILGLVEERGYAFQDIGVVARTFSGYETVLPRVFVQHGIPFVSTLGRALAEFPFIKTAMQLLQLRVAGYRRDHMMDLLSSPFLRLACLLPQGLLPRPDLWDLASRRLGITKGLDEWRRLAGFQDAGLSLRDDEEGEGTGPRIPAEQIRAAWSVVTALTEAIGAVPETASWSEYVRHVQTLVDRFLDPLAGEAASSASEQPDSLHQTFRDSLGELRELARFGPEVSLLEFVAALRRLMDETTVPVGPTESSHGVGVQVLDAMAARGVPFRALYVLGLNEKEFPRHIQEDAFLRDASRRFLEADLGFKIQEKLTGFDEEKLLFRLLCKAARDQLTLLYQRTDDAGRMLVPSSYLGDIRSQSGGAEIMVPRRLTRKFEEGLSYRVERLTPVETGIKLLLDRIVPRQLLEVVHPAGRLVTRGLHALREQETVASTLGAYDGLTGPLASFWLGLKQRGLSPTSLQEYATCPFRYFAGQVLRLDSLVMPEVEDQIGPIELGVLAHGILRACHERLHQEGYFALPSRSSVDPLTVLEEAAHRVFGQFAFTHPVGFPVVWELHQERLLGFLRDVLREDLAELAAEGWEPVLFEEPLTGTLEVVGAVETGDPETVSIAGRLDRVDWSAARKAYRIIDYKFKASREPVPLDKNLPLGAVRGLRLQPPLYLAMAGSGMSGRLTQAGATGCEGEGMTPSAEGVWFYYLAQRWEARHGQALTRAEFPGNAWTAGLREPLERVLRHVLGGIKAGRFFIYPDGYCEHCDYRLICRATHQPTSWRSRSDHATVRPYRDIRRAKLSDSPADHNVPSSPRTRRPRKPSGAAGEGS